MSIINFPDPGQRFDGQVYSFANNKWKWIESKTYWRKLAFLTISDVYFNTNSELIFVYSNGDSDNLGLINTEPVTTIDLAYINTQGELIIDYSNGSVVNLGSVNGTGGSLNIATDSIWNSKGDLVVGSGNNSASILPAGNYGDLLCVNSSGNLEWFSSRYPRFDFTENTNNINDPTPNLYETVRYTTSLMNVSIPAGAEYMLVAGAGGGGGGSGGMNVNSLATRDGGGGGQGGQGWLIVYKLTEINSPTLLNLYVGAGGSGGAGAIGGTVSTGGTNPGGAGQNGGDTIVTISNGDNTNTTQDKLLIRFMGGQGALINEGGRVVGGGSSSKIFNITGGRGGNGSRSTGFAGAGMNNYYGGGGGGGGAGGATSGAERGDADGGAGGVFDGLIASLFTSTSSSFAINLMGAQSPKSNTNGAGISGPSGADGSGLFGGGGGAGGGGGRQSQSNNGGDGGNGGAGGGGGGGGGCLVSTAGSTLYRAGNGGNGGNGFIALRFW